VPRERPLDAGPERGALAAVDQVRDDIGAGRARRRAGVIRGPVVYDDDVREVAVVEIGLRRIVTAAKDRKPWL